MISVPSIAEQIKSLKVSDESAEPDEIDDMSIF